jgi:hypothetical protein
MTSRDVKGAVPRHVGLSSPATVAAMLLICSIVVSVAPVALNVALAAPFWLVFGAAAGFAVSGSV